MGQGSDDYSEIKYAIVKKRELIIVKYTTILSRGVLFGSYIILSQKSKCAKNENEIIFCSGLPLLYSKLFHCVVKKSTKKGLEKCEKLVYA